MAKFQIYSKRDGLYYFNLIANNGQVLLSSEAYTTKSACMNGIASIKMNALKDDRYVIGSLPKGNYFSVKASNGEILASSETYVTQSAMDNAIHAVKNIVKEASIT